MFPIEQHSSIRFFFCILHVRPRYFCLEGELKYLYANPSANLSKDFWVEKDPTVDIGFTSFCRQSNTVGKGSR